MIEIFGIAIPAFILCFGIIMFFERLREKKDEFSAKKEQNKRDQENLTDTGKGLLVVAALAALYGTYKLVSSGNNDEDNKSIPENSGDVNIDEEEIEEIALQ